MHILEIAPANIYIYLRDYWGIKFRSLVIIPLNVWFTPPICSEISLMVNN